MSRLNERLAPTLADLDELEIELGREQSDLAARLSEVEGELGRVTAIRAAILGGSPKPSAPARPARPTRPAKKSAEAQRNENRERLLAYAREHPEGFSGSDARDALGLVTNGIGPMLGGLVRAGELISEAREGERPVYRLAEGHSLYQPGSDER